MNIKTNLLEEYVNFVDNKEITRFHYSSTYKITFYKQHILI